MLFTPQRYRYHLLKSLGVIVNASDNLIFAAQKDGYQGFVGGQFDRIYQEAEVYRFAGGEDPGFVDGSFSAARFNDPQAFAFRSDGYLVVADTGNHSIRLVSPSGNVSTLAGSEEGFADGPGPTARFNGPVAVAVGPDDTIYVADSENQRIRSISPTGEVDTYASTTQEPHSVVVDPEGKVIWGQWAGIWTLDEFDEPTRIAGTGAANVNFLPGRFALAHDGKKLLALGNGLGRIKEDGTIEVLMPNGSQDGPTSYASASGHTQFPGLVVDHEGRWYFGENGYIRKKRSDGWFVTLAGGGEAGAPITGPADAVYLGTNRGLAVDSALRVYFRNGNTHAIYQITQKDGDDDGIPDVIESYTPGLAVGRNDAITDSLGTGQSNAMRWLTLQGPDDTKLFQSRMVYQSDGLSSTLRLEFPTTPRAIYRIEASSDLIHWWIVETVDGESFPSGATIDLELENDSSFFRIRPIHRDFVD